MSQKINLLAHVRQYLISRNEEFEWITMGPNQERVGLAYLPYLGSEEPCTFMFTELRNPSTLVFDAHFTLRVAQEDLPEMSLLLATLNANLREGNFMLDVDGGFVYFRHTYSPDMENFSVELFEKQLEHIENIGVNMRLTYARIIAEEFGNF